LKATCYFKLYII